MLTCILVRGIQLYNLRTCNNYYISLSGSCSYHHGLFAGRSLLAGLAFHHSHLCRGSDHDTERFYTDHQSDRSHPFVRFGFSLCTIYSHHQPKQNYQQYIKQPAYILCTDSRCNYLLWENYIIRHSYNNRTYRKHGLVEPCRSCDSSDCRINRYIGYCDTKHRSHQSIRPWSIRTRYSYSHWNRCLWRSSHNQYHCRNFTFHSSHNLYDCQNKKIGSGL